MSFTYKDVLEAKERINGKVKTTPLEQAFYLGDENRKYFFKLESMQRAKSFKIRGAVNRMSILTEEERKNGVATISSGNNGCAVSYASTLLDIEKVEVIVPKTTPKSKVDKIEYFGAKTILMGENYDEAHEEGMKYVEENKMTYIDPYDIDPVVYAGQGTVALEILEQNPQIDTIVVPIGGGGLITGIAVAAKGINPNIRIIGVQTSACPALIKSYEDGVCYTEYPTKETLCDCLVGGIGRLCYKMAKDYVDDIVEVSEDTIAKATAFMIQEEKYVAEAGSCAVIAAVWEHGDRIGGKEIALVISGANIDGDLIGKLCN